MGHGRGYEFRMTLRFQTKAARWMGTLYLLFIETWVAEGRVDFDGKDDMTPFGLGKFEVPRRCSSGLPINSCTS